MKATVGALVVSANIAITDAEDTTTKLAVKAGDTITDVVYQYGSWDSQTEEIAEAEVVGFTARPSVLAKRATRIYDGVPSIYGEDANGGAFWGTIDEIAEVESIVVKIADKDKTGKPTGTYSSKKLYVERIQAMKVSA